ncbi:hypothetical protein GBAR_LOCUS11935, partial [Geodia barretti]
MSCPTLQYMPSSPPLLPPQCHLQHSPDNAVGTSPFYLSLPGLCVQLLLGPVHLPLCSLHLFHQWQYLAP